MRRSHQIARPWRCSSSRVGFFAFRHVLGRQQHARLDLDQHSGHRQILGREFEIRLADLVDVAQVLPREPRHRDVEDVEVLLPDQVEQQVERPLEGLEEDLERIGRDVEVGRQREQRLAVEPGEGDLIDHVGHGGDQGSTVVGDDLVLRGATAVVRRGAIALPAAPGARYGPNGHLLDAGL